jgi:peptidoglycan/LPS O-acetylase OafA/YrhL
VEVHFYLIWPVVVMLLCLLGRQRAIVFLILLYIAGTYWRMFVFDEHGWLRAYYAFDTRVTGLVLGGLFALLSWRPQGGVADRCGAAALFVILIYVAVLPFYGTAAAGWCAVLVEMSAGILILAILSPSSKIGAVFSHPVMVRLGLWSYGIYLWHYPIAGLTRVTYSGTVSFLITITISLILAGLSYELVEKRTTRWLQARSFVTRRPTITADGPIETREIAPVPLESTRHL